jgi:transposase
VLKMVEVEVIKLKRAQGWSIRKIARQLGYSRQAVRRALEAPAEPPRYALKQPRPQPVMGPYLLAVEAMLKADEQAPSKQRHTARRVYERLAEEHGYAGSEVTVRRAVRRLRRRQVEMYVPLEAPPGKIAQADFGKAQLLIGGRLREVSFFCMRAKASGVPFAVAYPTERLEAFLAGHVVRPSPRSWPIMSARSSSTSRGCAPTTSSARASATRRRLTRRAPSRTWWAMCAATRLCLTTGPSPPSPS